MNLKHLETFYHFCRFMTMSRTADYLHVTQPAVSQQLSSFQAECRVCLFHRDASGYRLTPTGEAVFLLTKRIFARVSQIEELLEKAARDASAILRIGTTKTYARTVMPDLITKFQERFPGVQLRLSEGNSADLIRRLLNHEEDLVVAARSQYDLSLKAIPFAKCEFILVARPDHALALREPVSVKDLSGEQMILRERGSGSRSAILENLAKFGVHPPVLVESESFSFILAYLERRKGVSFMLSHEVEDELARGSLKQIRLAEGNISFESDIVVRRNEPLSQPMRHFVKLAKTYMPDSATFGRNPWQ
jgi:DNA-binding transcriptional LysR family regulator